VNNSIHHVWAVLAATPQLWLAITVAAYVCGLAIQRACGGSAFASPVLTAIFLISLVVLMTGTDYRTYFANVQLINFLLGPATVALAIPLARNGRLVRENLHSIALALIAGSLVSIVSGCAIVWLFGGAATTPIAVAISQEIGGIPALTVVLAILGGILAALVGELIFCFLKIRDWRSRGLAAGIAGSGVAATQIARRSELGAAFAAVGIAAGRNLASCPNID
jgi:putative effector of murein hydrolase